VAGNLSKAAASNPPCRGFAYVEFTPTDDKALVRCLSLYNGCKWKGGVMAVHVAKPRFQQRFQMERDGVEVVKVGRCRLTLSNPRCKRLELSA